MEGRACPDRHSIPDVFGDPIFHPIAHAQHNNAINCDGDSYAIADSDQWHNRRWQRGCFHQRIYGQPIRCG